MNNSGCGSHPKANVCCQTNGGKCQQQSASNENFDSSDNEAKVSAGKKNMKQLFRNNGFDGIVKLKVCALPWWFENWEREHTYAALPVVCAAVSVGILHTSAINNSKFEQPKLLV